MNSKSGKFITFLPTGKVVQVSQKDETLLQVAIRNSLPLNHTCGGFGTCGTCRVLVEEGLESLPDRNEVESEIAHERGFSEKERLACQCPPIENLVLVIPTQTIE